MYNAQKYFFFFIQFYSGSFFFLSIIFRFNYSFTNVNCFFFMYNFCKPGFKHLLLIIIRLNFDFYSSKHSDE